MLLVTKLTRFYCAAMLRAFSACMGLQPPHIVGDRYISLLELSLICRQGARASANTRDQLLGICWRLELGYCAVNVRPFRIRAVPPLPLNISLSTLFSAFYLNTLQRIVPENMFE